MSLSSVLRSLVRALEMLVLSWTSHARLSRAKEPCDYETILTRTIREVKFHSKTLLSVLFFMGARCEKSILISCTLACLLFTLITYTALEAMSGDALHKWIDEIPCGRVFLACLSKLPGLSVIWTLCALALSQWDTPFTMLVLCCVAGVLVLALAVHLRVHLALVRFWSYVFGGRRAVDKSAEKVDADVKEVGGKSDGESADDAEALPVGAERV